MRGKRLILALATMWVVFFIMMGWLTNVMFNAKPETGFLLFMIAIVFGGVLVAISAYLALPKIRVMLKK